MSLILGYDYLQSINSLLKINNQCVAFLSTDWLPVTDFCLATRGPKISGSFQRKVYHSQGNKNISELAI